MQINTAATNPLRLGRIFFYGICAATLVICVISFVSTFSWINKTFPGFYIYNYGRVGSMGSIDWPGAEADLKFMERITAVDGQPVSGGREIVTYAAEKPPGTPIIYTILSAGQARKVSVPTAKFRIRDFFIVFLVPFVGGTIIFSLGCIVYMLKPDAYSSWIFFFFCLFLGIYIITSIEMQSTYVFAQLNYVCIPLVPATLFHLCLIFPDRKRIVDRYPVLEYIVYLPAFILLAGYMAYLFSFSFGKQPAWIPDIGSVTGVNRIFWLVCLVGLIGLLIHSLYRATSTAARQRAKMIIFGVTFAFLPSVMVMLAVALLKVTFPWNFLVFFAVLFPASIAYSIVKHNLFDADTIIRRTVGYAVVTAVVVGAYLGVSLSFNVFLGQYQLAQSRVFPILFTLGVLLIFNPLRDRIQAIVDRVFFRKEYNYGDVIDKIGGAITSLMDLGQILKSLTGAFTDDMFINTTSVMLLSPDGATYEVYLADGENQQDIEELVFNREEPVVEIIEKEKKALTKYDVLEDPKYKAVSESCAANFDALSASLIMPLVFQEKVIGLLNLGEKKSGKFYNREDIDLLNAVSNQGAVAIENARLFQENLEKQRMEEELAIARDMQTSMLPAACPKIDGFEIAALSIPAREVGGDFYDFVEMSDEKLGFVSGDVTGKSVSGALVMSASRSVFRMLSEEQLTVGEIMKRANRRTKKDIKSGMFVALLYAVLNSEDMNLSLCSAGQTQPVHLSAKTGKARLVETEGDTFPLGILEEVDYQETRMQLEPGDRVILYTDGIVEAMNTQKEMFGFERLLDVVQGVKSLTADSLLKAIIDQVNDFAGDAAQHDDLTAIVVSVEG
jgi:sigma-B regulation protein RsbU (phosphoserine phosphatase)